MIFFFCAAAFFSLGRIWISLSFRELVGHILASAIPLLAYSFCHLRSPSRRIGIGFHVLFTPRPFWSCVPLLCNHCTNTMFIYHAPMSAINQRRTPYVLLIRFVCIHFDKSTEPPFLVRVPPACLGPALEESAKRPCGSHNSATDGGRLYWIAWGGPFLAPVSVLS
jgi:hypothetical protein